ncbi:MAG: cytochrome P450 [Pseudomonadota bacterium]|nr:cytochrome P450 [Pseudomonadota bacterium]
MSRTAINLAQLPQRPADSKLKQGLSLSKAPFEYLSKNMRELGDAFTLTVPASPPMVFLNTPAAVKAVLAIPDDHIDQSRMPFPIDIGEKNTGFLGGTEHRDGRKILIPNVNTERLQARAVAMFEIIKARVDALQSGEQLDMTRFVGDVTLDIACYSLTGHQAGPVKERYKYLMAKWLHLSTNNTMFMLGTLVGATRWRQRMHHRYQRKLARAGAMRERRVYFTPWGRAVDLKVQLDRMLREDIRAARAEGDSDRNDILYYLSIATDSAGELLSEERVIAESLAVLFGGHETSAGTGGFFALWLLKHPQVVEKIVEEVQTSIGEHGEFNALAVSQLRYLNAALMESQRLTPTILAAMRCLVKDVRVAGYDLPAGVGIMVSPYLIGRRQDVWGDDADSYRPERWLENRGAKPSEFFPFGGGHRTCVGMNQARQQLKILFAYLLLRTEWQSSYSGDGVWPGESNVAGTTQPNGGVPITITRKA